ncbi:CPXCG motif-containing cysteine-rich protein [Plesiomonas shigelloides subsp. oncorhynchi]|nr:CPXCG motif-containing cysteine-rich protein [Plesiomonas shigelloides]
MRQYSEKVIECPHCGHHMRVALDYSNGNQSFTMTALPVVMRYT